MTNLSEYFNYVQPMKEWAKMTFEEWLEYGIKLGYCTPQVCQTHDSVPMTDYEEMQWEEGHDPCIHVVRLGAPDDWDNGEQG